MIALVLLLAGCAARPATTAPPAVITDTTCRNHRSDLSLSRLPVKDVENQPSEEIVRRLIVQWLDYYKTDCPDPYYRLDTFSITKITLEKASMGFQMVAFVVYELLPARPMTADFSGRDVPNGWIGTSGTTLPDGTQKESGYFGVTRDGDQFRLQFLVGWGT